ncbi:MAG: ATP-binding protein [Bacteroidetes bacterium]|nr:ATP-binding protein [Bacteroidota bacterium]
MNKFRLLFLLLPVILFSSCNQSVRTIPLAKDGVLDLSNWDFEKNGDVKLDGSWEFYWNQLYTPQDFKPDSLPANPVYLTVPGAWNDLAVHSEKITGQGFATYRLKVKLNHSYPVLAIKLLDAASSYQLWINHDFVASNGTVSSIPGEIKPQMHPLAKNFNAGSDQLEIVVQVANNFHHKGGLWESIRIGTPEHITQVREENLIFAMFLAGTLFILFIYHLWIFLLRRTEKAAFWFAILCFDILMRTFLINERLIYYFFPGFSINIGYRIEYLSMFTSGLFFSLYLYHVFSHSISKTALQIIGSITCIVSIIILFTPTPFYTSIVIGFQAFLYSEFIYFFILSIRQVIKKQQGAVLLLFSWLAALIFGLNDILYLNFVINTGIIGHYGFFIFILTQAYILSYKISDAFHTIEDLSVNLEHKVEDRTRELKETQSQLVRQEKLAALGQMTAGIAHEIKNPLNFVNNFSEVSSELVDELMLAKDESERKEIAGDLKRNLSKITEHGKRADSIVKGMLMHSRSSGSEKIQTDINELSTETMTLALHSMRATIPDFECEIVKSLTAGLPGLEVVEQDLSRVILNLLNNAFYSVREKDKSGSAGRGHWKPMVSLTTKLSGQQIIISIRDNGNGIPEAIKEKIFHPFFTTKPAGQGTGLGLSLSYDIVKAHGGEIKVESTAGEGTEFMIVLPVCLPA